jgi:hypothetical protein
MVPNVNPSAGETNLAPKIEKAPDTGNMADISPLSFICSISPKICVRVFKTYKVITTQYTKIPTTKYETRALPGPANATALRE